MSSKVDGFAIAGLAAGSIFMYAGLTGRSVLKVFQSVVQGQQPALVPQDYPITGQEASSSTQGSSSGSSVVTSSAIANDALKYVGHKYVYGGAPGPNGTNGWDCSSFVNWVLNHDLNLPIPGFAAGQWNPNTHGPATGSYASWNGVTRIKRNAVQAGDLALWATHIGIIISSTQMVSAQSERLGTRVSGIVGPGGESLTCLRINAASSAMTSGANPYPGGITGRV